MKDKRKKNIYKMALEQKPIKEVLHYTAEGIFCNKNRFTNEDDFVLDLIGKLPSIIKQVYNEDIKSYRRESPFKQKRFGYFNVRADIEVLCYSGKKFIIECKNPTHSKAEILNSVGQMIGYQMIFDNMDEDVTIILATSVYKFYMTEAIKKHNIKTDIILNNKVGVAFLLNEDL